MKSLFDTLNIVYGEQEKRGFVKLNAISLGFTLAGTAFILSALAAVVVLPVILNYLWLSNFVEFLVNIARWPAMFIVLLRASIASDQAARLPAGAGSRSAVLQQPFSGSARPQYFPGTLRISASSTKPTDHWVQ